MRGSRLPLIGPPSAALRRDLGELQIMEEAFAHAEFRVLISGNMAEIGGLGQSDQAASNAACAA